jgi:tRNA(Glu) U13 pseudouridine synthase TruD
VLNDEQVSQENFRVEENPELGSRGTRRAALCTVKPQIRVEGNIAELEFVLPKGSYATVVLREYMKGAAGIRDRSEDRQSENSSQINSSQNSSENLSKSLFEE